MKFTLILPLIFLLSGFAWATPIRIAPFANSKQDAAYVAKYMEAAGKLEKIVNSEKFRAAVLSHQYLGKPGFANTGLSPAEVLSKALSGSEILTPGVDHIWSWEVVFYFSRSSTVGYTYPNTMQVHVNTRFFDRYTLPEVMRNQAHEYFHKLGFDHDRKATSRRPFSVPYAIGSIVERLAREEMGQPESPTPKPRPSFWRRLFFWL